MSAPKNPSPALSWPLIARRIRVPMGFLFAGIYLWLAHPLWESLAAGAILCLAGIWLRALASGHLQKNMELTTSGPYAYTRNPLYLGSIIIAVGFAVAALSIWVWIGLLIMFTAIYLPVIRAEEAYLRAHFTGFGEYFDQVPVLLPKFRAKPGGAGGVAPAARFSRERYLRHREYNALVGAAAMMLALVLKILWHRKHVGL